MHLGGSSISAVYMTHVLLKDDDESPTETATVDVVTHGTSRWEEQTGSALDDTSTQGTTVAVVTQGNSRWEEQIGNAHDQTGHNLSDFTQYGK